MSLIGDGLQGVVKQLLADHAAIIKEFIPAKAGLDPERAEALGRHAERLEKLLEGISLAKTSEDLKAVLLEIQKMYGISE